MIQKLIVLWNILLFKIKGVDFGSNLRVRGLIILQVFSNSKVKLGQNVTISSGNGSNPMGRNIQASIRVHDGATLIIGDNFGMSSTCLWASKKIIIGNNVKIGALSIISDTDAHSLDPVQRANPKTDFINSTKAPITIKDNVFIGANCFIGKGVTIGKNCIIGAGSVVTKSIPDNEIWAGNPAVLIKKLT